MATRRMTMQPLVALRDYSVFMTVIFLALLLKHILSMAEKLSSLLEKKAGVWFGPTQVGRESEQEPRWFEAARANVCSQDMEMEKANLFTETCFNCNISDQDLSLLQQNNTPKHVSITSDRLKVYIWYTLLTRPETERENQLKIRLNSLKHNNNLQLMMTQTVSGLWVQAERREL